MEPVIWFETFLASNIPLLVCITFVMDRVTGLMHLLDPKSRVITP